MKPFIIELFLGILFAYALYPLYNYLNKKLNNKKTISAVLICLFVFLILIIPTIFFVKALITESYVLFIVIKQKLAVGLLQDCNLSVCDFFNEMTVDLELKSQIQDLAKTLATWIVQKSSDFLVSIPNMIISMFVMFFAMYYSLKEGDYVIGKLNQYLNLKEEEYSLIVRRLKEIVHGVVFGYIFVAVIQGALGALGFFIFGISSPLFWGLVMAFLALIPYLGTGLVWVPAALILFFNGYFQDSNILMIKGIALLVYGFIFVGTLDNILRPMLMGDKAKIHPAIIMLGIFGGIYFFGALGVILGPLILSLTTVVLQTYLVK